MYDVMSLKLLGEVRSAMHFKQLLIPAIRHIVTFMKISLMTMLLSASTASYREKGKFISSLILYRKSLTSWNFLTLGFLMEGPIHVYGNYLPLSIIIYSYLHTLKLFELNSTKMHMNS